MEVLQIDENVPGLLIFNQEGAYAPWKVRSKDTVIYSSAFYIPYKGFVLPEFDITPDKINKLVGEYEVSVQPGCRLVFHNPDRLNKTSLLFMALREGLQLYVSANKKLIRHRVENENYFIEFQGSLDCIIYA